MDNKQEKQTKEAPDPLVKDVEQFHEEKERVRNLIGQIGGERSRKGDCIAHYVLITALVLLFLSAIVRHITGWEWVLPPVFSLEIGLFLVSIKIIWMLHKQTQVAHFQFWILNTIEFRILDTVKRLRRIEERLDEREEEKQGEREENE